MVGRLFVMSALIVLSFFAVVARGVRMGVLPIGYGAPLLSSTWGRVSFV
jgi:hypothetical protein